MFVPIKMDEEGWERISPAVDSIRDDVGTGGDGMTVHITGPGGTSADFAEAFEGIDSTLLLSAMTVVVVMLLITYRSLTLLLIPLIAVVCALFTSQALIYLLAEHAGLTVNGQSAGILTVLVFGAGTDYALLLVARYREELRRHEDRHEAMALALHRAGPAVLASGATVVLSMLVLLAAEMNSTSGLGPVAAIGVAVALVAMMSLFPALLVIFGRWIFWPVVPHYGSPDPTERGVWARTGRRIARRPRMIWAVTALALAFRYVFDYAGEATDFPLFVFVFLVALGIDYNIFLTTRIREEAARQGTRGGVVTGLAATGAVITSAGLVLAGTFAALGTLPMVAFAEIGFTVALGVLIDTFIVRSVLVTSLFLDVGPKVWWPHRLARHDGGAPDRAAVGAGVSRSDE